MITFSVIIPCYNAEPYIKECLESVFAQSYAPHEVIVIDDGSTDGSLGLIKEYEGRIKVITQENSGAGGARNAGMRVATGDYFAFLDADDIWLPKTLEIFFSAIKNTKATVIAGHSYQFMDIINLPPSIYQEKVVLSNYKTPMHAVTEGGFWLFLQGALAVERLSALSSGGYPCGLSNSEDTEFIFKLSDVEGCCIIKEPPLFLYRRHTRSSTFSLSRSYNGLNNLLKRFSDNSRSLSETAKKGQAHIIAVYSRSLCVAALKNNNFKESLFIYRKTFYLNLVELRIKYLLGVPALFLVRLFVPFFGGKNAH